MILCSAGNLTLLNLPLHETESCGLVKGKRILVDIKRNKKGNFPGMLTYNIMHFLKTPFILNNEEKKHYGLQTFLLVRVFQYVCTYKITVLKKNVAAEHLFNEKYD